MTRRKKRSEEHRKRGTEVGKHHNNINNNKFLHPAAKSRAASGQDNEEYNISFIRVLGKREQAPTEEKGEEKEKGKMKQGKTHRQNRKQIKMRALCYGFLNPRNPEKKKRLNGTQEERRCMWRQDEKDM